MKEIEEIKRVYEKRYENRPIVLKKREQVLYRKYNALLIDKNVNQSKLTCLDLGCGEGDKIIGFTSGFKSVLAVDLSEKAITICNTKFNSPVVEFISANALEIEGKFDIITAFGFSLFNTDDNRELVTLLNTFIEKNMRKSVFNTLIIGSFTDYSGEGKDSWYKHTKTDLEEILTLIERITALKARIIFPHKLIKNYFGYGLYNFSAEIYKLIFKRKKTYFIVIDNGQRNLV